MTCARLRDLSRHLPAIAILSIIAACSGSISPAPAPAHGGSAGKSSPTPAESSAAAVGQGFATTDSSGNKYSVYLTRVIDPAQGSDSFTTPDSGKRFVGAVFTIKGVKGSSSDDANNDATLIGSNGQTYQADFNTIKGYTNFNAGQFNAGPGAVQVGAVTFQVPKGVKVSEIQWSASGGFGGPTGTWKVKS